VSQQRIRAPVGLGVFATNQQSEAGGRGMEERKRGEKERGGRKEGKEAGRGGPYV
jgi:hypothetical protein